MLEIGVTFLNPDGQNVKLENWYLCHADIVDGMANKIVIALDLKYYGGEIHTKVLTRYSGTVADGVISGRYSTRSFIGGIMHYDIVFTDDIDPSLFEIYREVDVGHIRMSCKINNVNATIERVLLNRMDVVMAIGTTAAEYNYMVGIEYPHIIKFGNGNWLKWSTFISINEERWNRLYHGLIHKLRIEHKMRPDGPFMTKLIERDQDFQNGENTKN